MALFEVPGWSVPSAPVAHSASNSKKRKRPAQKDGSSGADVDGDEAERMQSAQRNIERLMRSLGEAVGVLDEDGGRAGKKRREEKKEKAKAREKTNGKEKAKGKPAVDDGREQRSKAGEKRGKAKAGADAGERKPAKEVLSPVIPPKTKTQAQAQADAAAGDSLAKSKKKEKRKKNRVDEGDARSDAGSVHEEPLSSPPKPSAAGKGKAKAKQGDAETGLTALQANMKKSLGGARFRWINEMLYKSDSAEAHELMRTDPAVFSDYHTGFRHQVESWPTNPVSHYISTLSSYPERTVIADLGCGDAALARALVPKGLTVLSFDLRADGAYVIEADTCSRVPLPGSEGTAESAEGEGQVVDVVVCALSLMGTNWPECIREAWRILRAGGEFKIAEVTSRFSDVEEFVSFVSSFGFKLKSKDERNTHFTLFEFKKIPRKPKSEQEWSKLGSRANILKPCEYKRR